MVNTKRKQYYHITVRNDDEKHNSSKWTTTLSDRCCLWAATKRNIFQISIAFSWQFHVTHHFLIISFPDRQLIFYVIRMTVRLSSSIVNKSNKMFLCRFVDGGNKGVPSVWAGLGSVLWESTWQPPRPDAHRTCQEQSANQQKNGRAGQHLMSEWARKWI